MTADIFFSLRHTRQIHFTKNLMCSSLCTSLPSAQLFSDQSVVFVAFHVRVLRTGNKVPSGGQTV